MRQFSTCNKLATAEIAQQSKATNDGHDLAPSLKQRTCIINNNKFSKVQDEATNDGHDLVPSLKQRTCI